jgi:hypothetical protein
MLHFWKVQTILQFANNIEIRVFMNQNLIRSDLNILCYIFKTCILYNYLNEYHYDWKTNRWR